MKIKDKYHHKISITHIEHKGVEYVVKCQQEYNDENITWEIEYMDDEYFDPIELDICSELSNKLITFATKNQ